MNRIAISLLSVPMLCFGFSDYTKSTLDAAWDLHYSNHTSEAIELLTARINDPSISNVEKVHYLNTRMGFYLAFKDYEKSTQDSESLRSLCISDPEADNEMWEHYEYSFIYSRCPSV